jgi:glutamate-1-semialdehyde 2,1-aminomutase
LSPGGAQEYFNVIPDLTILGKILGGGFPIGGIAGKREIMERLDATKFERPQLCFHGGTFCANPITTTAGLTMLKQLEDGSVIRHLNKRCTKLKQQLKEIFDDRRIRAQITGEGSLFQAHFTDEKIRDVRIASREDKRRRDDYYMNLMANGVFFLPGKLGALSKAHTDADLDNLLTRTEAYASTLST